MLLIVNCFFFLLLWLSNAQAFQALVGVILLWSLLLFTSVLVYTNLKEKKKQKLFQTFITNPDVINEERLVRAVSQQEGEQIQLLASVLRNSQLSMGNLAEELRDYEEYVEGWAHEAKTPLSLLTMVLDNRVDEIPFNLQVKLDYIRSQFQEDIVQMLYYARLKSSTKDYQFEEVSLQSSLEEVLTDFAPLLEEKQFTVQNEVGTEVVFTDRRGLQFMLGQIISNAIKYSTDAPTLIISPKHSVSDTVLSVTDNGIGVKDYDLPYIFQKGFTGDSTEYRKKATGMGLYLTKKMADDLNLKLEVKSEYKKYFKISIYFPVLKAD